MPDGIVVKKGFNINTVRYTKQGTAAADTDIMIPYSTILTNVGVSLTDAIAIYVEGIRPTSSWGEVRPSPPFFLISGGEGNLGFHNFGTGGNYVMDIIVMYRDYS